MKRGSLTATLFALYATTQAAMTEAQAQEAASFSLAPGETRSFNIGFYREIRVCNNVGSAGTVDMTVGGQPPTTLAPGVCWRNSGDSLVLHNGSTGSVSGVYNANQTRPGRSGGGGGGR